MKIVKYSVDELIINVKDVSKNLNKICSGRERKWEITGVCQKDEIIIIALNECEIVKGDYIFAKVNTSSIEEIEVEIKSHWESGIYLMGIIILTDTESVALYRRESSNLRKK